MLVACPTSVTFDKISHVPYGKIPATYIVFESDVELKKELQEGMALGVLGDPSGAKAKAGEGRWDVRLEYVDGGHCAFIKKPEEVAAILGRCWERARKEYGL
jgi:hypothetical protein